MKSVDLWSEKEQQLVTFEVALEDDFDVPSPVVTEIPTPKVIVVRYKDEIYKFSPNTTDEELAAQIAIMNQKAGVAK